MFEHVRSCILYQAVPPTITERSPHGLTCDPRLMPRSRSWRTGYGGSSTSGGYQYSYETASGMLVYTKSVEMNFSVSYEMVHGLRLKVIRYELYEHMWGHGLGLHKLYRGLRIESVGLAPECYPPLSRY